MKNIRSLIIAIIILVAGFVLGIGMANLSVDQPVDYSISGQEDTSVSVLFDFGNGEVVTVPEVSVDSEGSLYGVLDKIAQADKISLQVKDYGGDLGVFIESINEVGGDSDAWWQYWVNNEYGEVGVSSKMVLPGDIIMFKYGGSQL